ncbi:hypothetical protein HELRODRAFT_94076 [Helobdella robusta]|uniref:Arf-GAP with coiled-coil, ANK repeat and PH domain-containing protein 2 n=1 Tax=Helobdella robusta TaxID=6412 RepID=T1G8Y9_HELRO|nr:hypothetical protein HELRODRAFT_94076 [Helobdella robusta]ESO06479.1 hypothetical protein HELRODRAFT_94076 [Helobdella robusta]
MVHFKDDTMLLEAIGKFTQCLSQWNLNYNTMIENCNSYFIQCMNSFIKNDIKRVKDSRRNFHKNSEDVGTAFSRNAQVPKSKLGECEEAASNLVISRNNFKKASIDYLFEVNIIQYKKRTEVLNCLLSHLKGHQSFIVQTNSTFNDLNPYIQQISASLQTLQNEAASTRQQLRNESNTVLNLAMSSSVDDHRMSTSTSSQIDVYPNEECMEGYLYKRTTKTFKSWVRRWFIVDNNQLMYCSQHKSREGAVIMERDLRLCNVVPFQDTDRRFCFQIISPHRTHLLQADNEKDCQKWVAFIQETAKKAYNRMNSTPSCIKVGCISADLMASSCSPLRCVSTKSPPSATSNLLPKIPSHVKSILTISGNDVCCDCGHPDPRWASFNLGVTLCIECSGIHRSFGVHKSKVKSVTLDAWEPDQVRVMEQLGNDIARRIFELFVCEDGDVCMNDAGTKIVKATPNCSREVREEWVTAKYLKRSFVRRSNSQNHPTMPSTPQLKNAVKMNDGADAYGNDYWLNQDADDSEAASKLLCRAAEVGNLPGMLKALALGADVNFKNTEDSDKTPLIYSLTTGLNAPVEFMLLNGSKVDVPDADKKTPLHHAAILGNAGQICLLLKRKANQHLKDINGNDALSIAVENADANVVTILRLARLNEEMKGSDGGFDNPSDDMFAEVFKDFSAIPSSSVDGASSTRSSICTLSSTTTTFQ